MRLEELATLLKIPELPSHIRNVELLIEGIVTASDSPLSEPSLRLIKGNGKRLRPFLVIAAATSHGGIVNDDVLACCAAIELLHIGSLVHDDIIDEAETRWNLPTVNTTEGVNQAILVGDYFLALAAAQAATVSKEVAYIIASTIAVMCEGQSQETVDNYDVERSIESYRQTIHKKTAALTAAACRVGALCAGLSEQQVQSLAVYGEAFGMAFQLTDDLLDFLATSKAVGKPIGNDVKEGVYTLPLLLALQGEYGDELRQNLKKNPKQTDIVDRLKRSGAFDATLLAIQTQNDVAQAALTSLGNNPVVLGLTRLPENYLAWALGKQSVLTLDSA